MRIISGTARGVALLSPKDGMIRPTLDRVRESLFNILAPRLEGARFLDLYAGTGANGLEALSRGAAEVGFVDSTPEALNLVRENLRRTRLAGRVTVLQFQLPQGLARIPGGYDIIFADPPYASDLAQLLKAVAATELLAEEGVFVLEHERRNAPPELAGFPCVRQKAYGDTRLSFFEHG